MRNKFAFFANFAETIRATLPLEKQADAYKAICEFGIYETLPNDPFLQGMCLMARVSIQKNDGRSNNGGNHNPKGINQYKKLVNLDEVGQSGQFLSETEKETETETKNEDKIESIETSRHPPYAFEGKVIKLSQADFDNWKNTFPDLNLRAELVVRDSYLANQSENKQKNWFMATFQYFIKQNAKRKAQQDDFTISEDQEDFDTWFKRSV